MGPPDFKFFASEAESPDSLLGSFITKKLQIASESADSLLGSKLSRLEKQEGIRLNLIFDIFN